MKVPSLHSVAVECCFEICTFFPPLFLRPYLQHMDVPRLRVESELQLLAYITATAKPDPSLVCDLHHS